METEEGYVAVLLSSALAPHRNPDEHPRRVLPRSGTA